MQKTPSKESCGYADRKTKRLSPIYGATVLRNKLDHSLAAAITLACSANKKPQQQKNSRRGECRAAEETTSTKPQCNRVAKQAEMRSSCHGMTRQNKNPHSKKEIFDFISKILTDDGLVQILTEPRHSLTFSEKSCPETRRFFQLTLTQGPC
jgi:hypothetical protein